MCRRPAILASTSAYLQHSPTGEHDDLLDAAATASLLLVGRTPIGGATIRVLAINYRDAIGVRDELEEGLFPPPTAPTP
ncbi:MAG TPA: hypothetical protein VKI65_06605 [Gemmataceae bacterium]|nr:hypothetical protein [Gemmataceae bacterium]